MARSEICTVIPDVTLPEFFFVSGGFANLTELSPLLQLRLQGGKNE